MIHNTIFITPQDIVVVESKTIFDQEMKGMQHHIYRKAPTQGHQWLTLPYLNLCAIILHEISCSMLRWEIPPGKAPFKGIVIFFPGHYRH
jgi:hypothetical protein